MPHATISARKVASDITEGMKTVINEAIVWADQKASDLGADEEKGAGPYASPATCTPSDLDPIASGVLPAMEAGSPGKPKRAAAEKPNDNKENKGN
ncbi:hypothetical protein K491DRAFT_597678 [Lophiostoma macrostomum CBS 122681]|uniref:Uncharacterized protein n=1 Tax=Lophiostoma macrostomum CBS 122681 TaxID=1314788 RepID=A0A6A6TAT9_9PLEO|nr:hypothetical protein K491DRAFT_597678 [Lophiostoma macrostomum CBS 122681]